jgi:hypothetical protein
MTEKQAFDRAMKKILSVSKVELQRRLDAEKAAKKASSRVRVGKRVSVQKFWQD